MDKKPNNSNFKFQIFRGNNSSLIKNALLRRENWEEVKENEEENKKNLSTNFFWRGANFNLRTYAIIEDCHKYYALNQTINHFENSRILVTKPGLVRSLMYYYRHNDAAVKKNYGAFDMIATSYIVTAGLEDQQYSMFIQKYKELQGKVYHKEHVPLKHCQENMWVIKPANLNQGRGIEVFKTLKDIQNFFVSKPMNSYWVVQKYIEKPLLYQDRKFDIRVWVTVTDKCDLFFYQKAYIRTCSYQYNLNDNDKNIHLTNNCLQQNENDYGKYEPGNTLPLEDLFEYLGQQYNGQKDAIQQHIIQRMKDIIIDTVMSARKTMFSNKRYNYFEFFGFDFLIDEDLRTWLIEVNTNPYLGVPNQFIKDLLPNMIDQMLEIVIDPIYPPKNAPQIEENFWELIYCEYGSSHSKFTINKRTLISQQTLYPLEQLSQISNKALHSKQQSQELHVNFENNGDVLQNNRNIKKDKSLTIMPTINQRTILRNNKNAQSLKHQKIKQQYKKFSIQDLDNDKSKDHHEIVNTSVEENTKINFFSKQKKETIPSKDLYYQLKQLMDSYPYTDFDPFYKYPNIIIGKVINWEIQSDQDLQWAHKIFNILINSRLCAMFTEVKYQEKLVFIIESDNILLTLQIAALEGVREMCKIQASKKKIIIEPLYNLLIRISISTCDTSTVTRYNEQCQILAIQSLVALGGSSAKRMYIPGETRDFEKTRKQFIEGGCLLCLACILKNSPVQKFQDICREFLIFNIEYGDYEYQKQLLENQNTKLFQTIDNSSKERVVFIKKQVSKISKFAVGKENDQRQNRYGSPRLENRMNGQISTNKQLPQLTKIDFNYQAPQINYLSSYVNIENAKQCVENCVDIKKKKFDDIEEKDKLFRQQLEIKKNQKQQQRQHVSKTRKLDSLLQTNNSKQQNYQSDGLVYKFSDILKEKEFLTKNQVQKLNYTPQESNRRQNDFYKTINSEENSKRIKNGISLIAIQTQYQFNRVQHQSLSKNQSNYKVNVRNVQLKNDYHSPRTKLLQERDNKTDSSILQNYNSDSVKKNNNKLDPIKFTNPSDQFLKLNDIIEEQKENSEMAQKVNQQQSHRVQGYLKSQHLSPENGKNKFSQNKSSIIIEGENGVNQILVEGQ